MRLIAAMSLLQACPESPVEDTGPVVVSLEEAEVTIAAPWSAEAGPARTVLLPGDDWGDIVAFDYQFPYDVMRVGSEVTSVAILASPFTGAAPFSQALPGSYLVDVRSGDDSAVYAWDEYVDADAGRERVLHFGNVESSGLVEVETVTYVDEDWDVADEQELYPHDAGLLDADGDGLIDLVMIDFDGAASTIGVFEGPLPYAETATVEIKGSLADERITLDQSDVWSLGDRSGDGYPEIAVKGCVISLGVTTPGEVTLCVSDSDDDSTSLSSFRLDSLGGTNEEPPPRSDLLFVDTGHCEHIRPFDPYSSYGPDDCGAIFGLGPDVTGTVDAETEYDWGIRSSRLNARLGAGLAWAGDQDGDGAQDLLVGRPGFPRSGCGTEGPPPRDPCAGIDQAGSVRGAAYLVLGPLSGEYRAPRDADVEFVAPGNGEMSGQWVGVTARPDGGAPDIWVWSAIDLLFYGFEGGGEWLP